MFLISINLEKEKDITKVLRQNNIKDKRILFSSADINYNSNFKKKSIVITEYNEKTIDYFSKLNKFIIVLMDKQSSVDNKYNTKKIIKVYNTERLLEIINKRKKEKKLANIKLAMLFLIVLSLIIGGTISYAINYNNMTKQSKIEKKIEFNSKKENIVFLGDSITEFYNIRSFYGEKFPGINSGTSGKKAYELKGELEKKVYQYNPTKIILMIGTNDLSHRSNEEIVNDITSIVKRIHKNRKKAKIYVESIYPVNNNARENKKIKSWMVAERSNARIQIINSLLEKNSKDLDYTYINMYDELSDENADLKEEYTIDGLHISEQGYEKITKKIKKIINYQE